MNQLCDLQLDLEPRLLARKARLLYVSDADPGYSRRRCGKGFLYLDLAEKRIAATEELERIEALRIPPAWTEVWICPHPRGHLQATGRDEKGRKQYRYHDRWQQASSWLKFERVVAFAERLPKLRIQVRKDLCSRADDRRRVLATAVALLDRTAIRVGNEEYLEENETYGLTTLTKEHLTISGSTIQLQFVGKSGKLRELELTDRLLANRLQELAARPGERVFQASVDGVLVPLDSTDVNLYLRDHTPPGCTAKTFRTWHGTVAAFEVLSATCTSPEWTVTKTAVEKALRESVKAAAELLGNTPAVCRSYYIHPAITETFSDSKLSKLLQKLRPRKRNGLSPTEQRLLAVLKRVERLQRSS